MPWHRLKLRFRRDFRIRKRQVEGIGQQAERQFERNFIRRLSRLVEVRRFVIGWALLIVLLGGCVIAQTRALSSYYQSVQPIAGGRYAEGIVGAYTNANPLYAASPVDSAVSHLIFAGLFKYDDKNQLVGDLAESGWTVDQSNKVYTVHLRPGLTWQDGKPLTASDVAFTYHAIQKPDAQSPLNTSWQNVVIATPNSRTVVFTLPNPLSSFPYSLTTGIIPEHILSKVPIDQLRSVAFNTTHPVGAGPFQLQTIEVIGSNPQTRQEEVQLKPFANYHGGKPKLASFVVHAFSDQDQMLHSFNKQELTAMVGLSDVPDNLAKDNSIQKYSLPLTAANMVFFKTTSGVLSDKAVRQALVRGADTNQILHKLDYQATPVREPFLLSQFSYDPAYQQPAYDPVQAAQILTAAGWVLGPNGIRIKGGQPLSFSLYAQNNSEYAMVANSLKEQWRKIGVDVQVNLQQDADIQATVAYHSYDALLYGISIGKDPDVFVYWHSSQTDVRSPSRLNFSEYKSNDVDISLENGRTRDDPALRSIKYKTFLQTWQQDSPALGLYQPRLLYITRGQVFGLNEHAINLVTDRYDNVENWMIRQAATTIGSH